MDKNQVRKDIEGLIANIKEHFDNALDQDHIPQLELENIVSKIEKLHQKAIVFHFLNERNSAVSNEIPPVEDAAKAPVQTDLFGSAIAAKPLTKPDPKADVKVEKEKIDDIRNVIGINDKFQFINELFEGEQNEYMAAINQLNNYSTFSEAELYLNSLKDIYKWKEDAAVLEKFIQIVKRKLTG